MVVRIATSVLGFLAVIAIVWGVMMFVDRNVIGTTDVTADNRLRLSVALMGGGLAALVAVVLIEIWYDL